MSHACTPILVGVDSLVSEILLLSKTAKFPFLTMDYSPWSSKNLVDRNQLKKFMLVGIDVTCMRTNFGGCGPDIASCIKISCNVYIHLLLQTNRVYTCIIARYFRVYTDILKKVFNDHNKFLKMTVASTILNNDNNKRYKTLKINIVNLIVVLC